AEAMKMRVDGKSLKEVAEVFNVSKSTISRLG
ncbi:MAG: helix-turn-helix domain-containing protein, partial [Mariprofundaceae bacterium]|nr:helix-turn-helix domain-containing protein [Mariprofundaceae bacterium]